MKKTLTIPTCMASAFAVLVLVWNCTLCSAQDIKNRGNSAKAVRAFVTDFGGDGVSVIDPERGRLIASVKTGSQPHGVAIAPDGRAVYVWKEGDGTLSFIDPATNEVLATIHVGRSPNKLAV